MFNSIKNTLSNAYQNTKEAVTPSEETKTKIASYGVFVSSLSAGLLGGMALRDSLTATDGGAENILTGQVSSALEGVDEDHIEAACLGFGTGFGAGLGKALSDRIEGESVKVLDCEVEGLPYAGTKTLTVEDAYELLRQEYRHMENDLERMLRYDLDAPEMDIEKSLESSDPIASLRGLVRREIENVTEQAPEVWDLRTRELEASVASTLITALPSVSEDEELVHRVTEGDQREKVEEAKELALEAIEDQLEGQENGQKVEA